MTDLRINPSGLRRASSSLQDEVDSFLRQTDALLAEVSDVTALGTNDTLGSLASMIYGLAIERVRETVQSVQQEYALHAQKLEIAAALYEQTEQANAASADGIV